MVCCSYVRFANSIAFSSPLTLYLNNTILVSNVSYRSFTRYFPIRSKRRQRFMIKGENIPDVSIDVKLSAGKKYTLLATGLISNQESFPIDLVILHDRIMCLTGRRICLQVFNGAIGLGPVSIILKDLETQYTLRMNKIEYQNGGCPAVIFPCSTPQLITLYQRNSRKLLDHRSYIFREMWHIH